MMSSPEGLLLLLLCRRRMVAFFVHQSGQHTLLCLKCHTANLLLLKFVQIWEGVVSSRVQDGWIKQANRLRVVAINNALLT